MAPIPVHIVTGPPGAAKSAFIARLCAQRPDWLGLVSSSAAASGPNLKALAPGCPCCTGRVVLQISLARALRDTRAVRALVELPDAGHLAALEHALSEAPLGLSVLSSRQITLPRDSGLQAEDLEP